MTTNQLRYAELLETRRNHLVTEAQGQQAADETARSHMANERYNYAYLGETTRHNVATETENNRHNVSTEQISRDSLQETTRHNMATENLGWAQLAETRRYNTGSLANAATNAAANMLNASTNAQYRPMEVSVAQQNADTAYANYQLSWLNAPYQRDLMTAQAGAADAKAAYDNAQAQYKGAEVVIDAVNAGSNAVKAIFGGSGEASKAAGALISMIK